MMQRLKEAIRTRGFYTSQVLWFLAGLYFAGILPHQRTDSPWLSDLLQRTLIVLILLPIYFSAVLNMAKGIDKFLDFVGRFFRK